MSSSIGALLRGVDRTQIERGQVLAKPGSIQTLQEVQRIEVYVLTKVAVIHPFFSNYRPQFYFKHNRRYRCYQIAEGVEMVNMTSWHSPLN